MSNRADWTVYTSRVRRPKGASGEEAREASFLARTRDRQDSDLAVTGVTGAGKEAILGQKGRGRRPKGALCAFL